jgi:ABC-type Fe3+/spermidine/putrescine transport system ATPase subunit
MKAVRKQIEEEPQQTDTRPDVDRNAPQPAARVVGIRKRFGKAAVLENINFDVAEGEILVLLGASGSGKTTILRIIAGLEEPDSGKVILHQKDVTELPARERGVGVIFQSYALFPKMNVEKNIGYGLRIRHRRRKEIKQRVNELLALVRLEEHRKKYPSQLSGGQQQRVAIARTLAYNPSVLLFDEPFGALDAQTRVHLRREIRALLKNVKVPSIFITHDQEEALDLGDRIAVLNVGHIEQIGTPSQVYNHPATEYVATFLGAANLLVGVLQQGNIEIGTAVLPANVDPSKYRDGDPATLIFRPEDVSFSKSGELPPGHYQLARGLIEERNFVGAYERLSVRLDLLSPQDEAARIPRTDSHEPQWSVAVPIIATRLKPETNAVPLSVGEQVTVGLSSFTVLPQAKTSKN